MTDLEIQEQAERMYPYKDGTSKTYTDANRSLFVKHAKWMQEQDKAKFINHINSVELSQKDKDLVKGVYYEFLSLPSPPKTK